MNSEASDTRRDAGIAHDPVAHALIANLKLSDEEITRITAAMQQDELSFSQAAVNLHLATPGQVKAASQADQLDASFAQADSPSIIEAARRKVLVSDRRRPHELKDPDDYCLPGPSLVIAHDAYCEHSERLRGLRTELTLRFGPTVLGVTMSIVSAGHSEGRSQLAAELAIAFAQLERRTLLVDADLRTPGLHKLFNCRNDVGMAQTLADGAAPFVFGVTGLPHLHLVTSGPVPNNPLELLSSKRFENLIHGWRQMYDFIIFDTPPVTAYADALTIATQVKRALLVARAHQSNLQDTKEALRRLSITHVEMMGSVLNHF